MIPALETCKMFLKENIESLKAELGEEKLNNRNVLMYYCLAKKFYLPMLAKKTFSYIERCFTMAVGSENFLHLDFILVKKILFSSELDITSEEQVLKAADGWISYDYNVRSKFSTDLLLTVRLQLLSKNFLRKIVYYPNDLGKSYIFLKSKECVNLIEEVLLSKETYLDQKKRFSRHQARYCSQQKFNIMLFETVHSTEGKSSCTNSIVKVDGENNEDVEYLTLISQFHNASPVNVSSEVFFLTRVHKENKVRAYKYCHKNNTFENLNLSFNNYGDYGLCSFMNKIIVVGGRESSGHLGAVSSCLELDTVNIGLKNIMNMEVTRKLPACAVFEGRVVVSGGYLDDDDPTDFHSVEAYDHVSDSWSRLPGMIHGRSCHQIVPVRNKLYVFGGGVENSEVFDSLSKKFSILKHPSSLQGMSNYKVHGAVSIGSRIIVFKNSSMAVFDLSKELWSEETFEYTKKSDWTNCIKVPKI